MNLLVGPSLLRASVQHLHKCVLSTEQHLGDAEKTRRERGSAVSPLRWAGDKRPRLSSLTMYMNLGLAPGASV